MAIKLKNKNWVPPGGFYKYRDGKTNHTIMKNSWGKLLMATRQFYKANSMPCPSEAEIEQAVCKNQPDACWKNESPSLVVQAGQVLDAAMEWARSGLPCVSNEELNRRLRVCEGCPYWGGVTGGSLIQGRCGKCGCSGVKLVLGTSKCPEKRW